MYFKSHSAKSANHNIMHARHRDYSPLSSVTRSTVFSFFFLVSISLVCFFMRSSTNMFQEMNHFTF